MLGQVLDIHHTPKRYKQTFKNKLHLALKTSQGIKSLTSLTKYELWCYINDIKALFAIELGIYLQMPGEPDDVEDITLTEYLKEMERLKMIPPDDGSNVSQEMCIHSILSRFYDLESRNARTRFLCDLTGTPFTSGLDRDRLVNEINDWIDYG